MGFGFGARPTPPHDGCCARQDKLDALLVSVGRGELDALAELYDELADTVYAMTNGSADEARERTRLTQEVFLQIWSQSARFDPLLGSAWSWVHAIALHALGSDEDPGSAQASLPQHHRCSGAPTA